MSSTISIDDLIAHAKNNKQTHVCLIDINVMHGALEFYQKAKANNLIPITGLQINYKNELVILVARDYVGYKNLLKISSCVCSNKTYDLNDYLASLFIIVRDKQNIN
jgi:DNA polymerase-3 subunit alpha